MKSKLSETEIMAVVNSEMPPEVLEKYPELYAVEEKGLKGQIQKLEQAQRADLVRPEARCLVQILAFFDYCSQLLENADQKEVETLILEVMTSESQVNLQDLTKRVMAEYDRIRERIISKIPPLSLVRILPEVIEAGRNQPRVGEGFVFLMSQRRLPPQLEAQFFKYFKIAYKKGETRQEYGERLADFYWKHRDTFLKAPSIELSKEELKALDLDTISADLRRTLEKETPELDLISDEEMIKILMETIAKAKSKYPETSFTSAADYNAIKIIYFLDKIGFDEAPQLKRVRDEMLPYYDQVTSLIELGASIPHIQAYLSAKAMEIYKKHRPDILAYLIKTIPLENLAATLPELRGIQIDSPNFGQEHFGVKIPFFPELKDLGPMAQVLRAHLRGQELKELENSLWNWKLDEKASDEQFKKISEPLLRKFTKLCLQHRSAEPSEMKGSTSPKSYEEMENGKRN